MRQKKMQDILELKALFEDIAWRERIAGYECDIYVAEGHIGVEIDGVYWHRRRPEQLAKSAALEGKGIQLFRLREDGLPLLSDRDISFKSSEDEFVVIARLLGRLLKFADIPARRSTALREYVDEPGLVNEAFYREQAFAFPLECIKHGH